MSREIKFRVWDKLAERFTKCDEGYQGHYILSLKGEFHNLQNGSGGNDYIVQQWTGLVDKNDVEIYEGDIIKYKSYEKWLSDDYHEVNDVVFYNPDRGAFVHALDPKTFKAGMTFDPYTFDPLEYEVIGNIFENPELLKA
jgi:uncharacterized phage protein (TIGR01671 family)